MLTIAKHNGSLGYHANGLTIVRHQKVSRRESGPRGLTAPRGKSQDLEGKRKSVSRIMRPKGGCRTGQGRYEGLPGANNVDPPHRGDKGGVSVITRGAVRAKHLFSNKWLFEVGSLRN